MIWFVVKVLISAIIIAFSSWLAGKRPELAGFIIALPLATLLALPFSYAEYKDPQASIRYAKSIFLAVPLSLMFFVPFLLADKLQEVIPGGFWGLYITGLACLVMAYFIHRLALDYL